MCAVVPRNLGKGGPLRASRCIPPGFDALMASSHVRIIETVARFIDAREGRSCPSTRPTQTSAFASGPRHKGVRRLWKPHHAIRAWRRPRGLSPPLGNQRCSRAKRPVLPFVPFSAILSISQTSQARASRPKASGLDLIWLRSIKE